MTSLPSIQYDHMIHHQQGGASLLVALVILIALTLIGVSSMNTAVIELKMANNSKQQGLSFNNAEELLTIAEQDIAQIVSDVKNGVGGNNPFLLVYRADGYYLPSEPIDVNQVNWNQLRKNTRTQGSYIIEYLGKPTASGESLNENAAAIGDQFYAYRITARSETGKAIRIVQSIYVTSSQPY